MNNIILIAPPAAGKGTLSENLVKEYGYDHISTGDLLRAKQDDGTELGNQIKQLLKTGALIDDQVVTELLKEKLESVNGAFILDGYPRNIKQAEILDNLVNSLGKTIDYVFYLNVDGKTAMERALGRVTCPKCKKIYNKYSKTTNPKNEGLCDICNVELIGRSDDNEESFKVRFDTYLENTKPLLDYYKNEGKLVIIDRNDTPSDTFLSVKKVIG